jgi:protein-tyrosine-phosphatase
MFNILVVCTGNVCRSPMAEYLLRDLIKKEYLQNLAQVESAGTEALEGYPAAEYTAAICEKFGLDTTPHRARSITLDMVKNADLILCMGIHHKFDLIKVFPQFHYKIFLLKQFGRYKADSSFTIEDPYGGPKENYEKTFLEIREEVFRIWPEITRRIEEKWLIEENPKRG